MADPRNRYDVNRRPGTFVERFRAQNWFFQTYRELGADEPGPETFAQYRTRWMAVPFGALGRPRLRTGPVAPLVQWPFVDLPGPRLLDPPAADDSDYLVEVRSRYDEARDWFVQQGPFNIVRPLGYGGGGLTILFRWTSPQAGVPDRDVVLKIGLEEWENEELRMEEAAYKQMSRAAHVIQTINPQDVGMPPKVDFGPLEIPYSDDSSTEGDSSGEDSRDNTAPRPPIKRRLALRNRLDQLEQKRQAHEARMRDRRNIQELRQRMIEQLDAQGSRLIPVGDITAEDLVRNQVDRKDFILLEYMQHGDMAHFIYKLNDLDRNVPNRVLWSFWLCMIRACIALEYPPRKFHPRRREPRDPGYVPPDPAAFRTAENAALGKIVGTDLVESIPTARRRWARKRWVHFDIDPKNILIGDLDADPIGDEHSMIPRLKLTDFGSSYRIKPNKGNVYYFSKRGLGKPGYYAPEQFGQEWEHIAVTDHRGPEVSEQRIAGNYGSATNIWGIALTMWQIITKLTTPRAPQRQNGEIVHYCPLLLTDPRYERVDRDLRDTIALCMAHDPRQRPILNNLMQAAELGARRVYPGESDDDIRRWVQTMIFDAP
ncbi:kinase-like protein [Hypoxylon crocopeplum]|nr:kinase-like protein [Hypoxylon crocopeplum]